jgi:hypothetical protein
LRKCRYEKLHGAQRDCRSFVGLDEFFLNIGISCRKSKGNCLLFDPTFWGSSFRFHQIAGEMHRKIIYANDFD